MRTRLVWAAMLGAAAAALAFVVLGGAADDAPPGGGGTAAGAGRARQSLPEAVTHVPVQRVVPEARKRIVRVIDAIDRRPLAGATVVALDDKHVTPTLGQGPGALTADENGCLHWLQSEAEDMVLARCPGYVPGVFRLSASSVGDLELAPAAQLTVEVIDDLGRPVADATACLVASPATPFLAADAVLTPGIGHPFSAHPQWVGCSDGTGRVVFAELPPGLLHLSVLSDVHVPTGAVGAGNALALQVGPQSVTVVIAEASAVVFGTLGAAKVRKVSWYFDRKHLDTSIHVVTRVARVRSALQQRFPDCQVLVHRLSHPDAEVVVTCHAQLEDDTLMKGVWAMQPISAIESPVQMERVPGVHHAITVRLQDGSGKELSGIALRLGDRETGFFMDTETGAKIVVPEGNYRVVPRRLDAKRLQELRELVVHVHPAGPREFVARLPYELSELVTEIELPGAESLGPLTIEVRDEHGQAPAVVNWQPSHGHPRHLLRGKRASVRITSVFYEPFEVTDHPLSQDGPTTLRARLVVKERTR